MLFNSYEFIFYFLPVTFFIYFYLNSKKLNEAAKGFLILASLFFYSWWNIVYLPIILVSMLFNYSVGVSLSKDKEHKIVSKKMLLSFGVISNVLLLGYFKYADFFIENFNFVSGSEINLLHLALPLAISFFTFQQIAYLADSYRRETKEYDFLNYSLFVTFFPQLIAGPIVHHKEMMPQFAAKETKSINYRNIVLGIFIFSMGLFKKVVIADSFSKWANYGYNHAESLSILEGWITSFSYSFQLYFDFSGYTDMAIGLALLFNIRIPINFNSPYKAKNIQDFWRRWHITLSRFLRDYVYIPLGGNKKGNTSTYTNLFLTFLIGGIWHGAGWTFVLWGALHGFAIVVHRIWRGLGWHLPKLLAWFITFNFVNITWVFFRAENFTQALNVLKAMFTGVLTLPIQLESRLSMLKSYGVEFGSVMGTTREFALATVLILVSLVITLALKNSNERVEKFEPKLGVLVFTVIIFMYSIYNMQDVSEFLYFNF